MISNEIHTRRWPLALMASGALLLGCPPNGGGGGSDGGEGDAEAGGPALDAGPDAAEDATIPLDGALGDGATDGAVGDAAADGEASDGAREGGGGAGDGGDGGGSVSCAFDAGTAPAGNPVCGDGWRAPTEECDDGLGASPLRRGCSFSCEVLDELAVVQGAADAGVQNSPRTIGVGRHPLAVSDNTFAVAYFEPQSSPLTLSLATFSEKGVATGTVNPFSTGTTVDEDSNPVLAALPCDQYVAAWTQLDAPGGDELDIALSLVNPSMPPVGTPSIANVTTEFSQFDPDVLWTGSEVVVAWVDDSDTATEPDIRFRTFDAALNPTSGEQTLAGTADSEADVALAPFGGSWAAAWRDDSNGLEVVQVVAGATAWTIGPAFLPAPVTAKPAVTALDATHLLVVYVVGVDSTDSGVANDSLVQVAVLDTAAPGSVTRVDVPAMVASSVGLDQSQPSAVTAGGTPFIAWWTAAATGDPNGEQVWIKQLGWQGASLDLSAAEISLPRWGQAEVGDQRAPALAASPLVSGGAVVAAWDDFGKGLGAAEADSDTAVEFVPVPVLRETGGGGGP